MAHIEIIVHKDGTTTQSVKGVVGKACQAASRNYEALFGDVTSHQTTLEAYEEAPRIAITVEHA